jgi:hypothetical protein
MTKRGDVAADLVTGGEGSSGKVLLVSAVIFVFFVVLLSSVRADELPVIYFLQQDRFVLLLGAAALGAAGMMRRNPKGLLVRLLPVVQPARFWMAALVIMAMLLWWGTHALMFNYPLTRDEHMVVFDMAVFAKGHLAEPLAPFWRPFAETLVPAFLLQPDHPAGLVSAYLPGNAALRLLFSHIADPALLNPLLAALGGLALLDIARREFPDDRTTVTLVMVIYITSAQMLVNAMTSYAMTAHLAFNMVWLAAFLRGGRLGHTVAIAVGVYACGLHQIIFHPLFAGPFFLWRLARGEWRIVIVYGVTYIAAGAAWMIYPSLAAAEASAPGIATASTDFLHERVLPLLLERDPNTMLLMGYNLARFFGWQNFALLPLMIAAWPAIRAKQGVATPLFGGMLLTLVLVGFLLLPYQGHGWGYRYLHGFIGSAALLGGHGLVILRRHVRAADGAVALLAALTLVSMPWLLFRAHCFVAPHVRLDKLMTAQTTPFVLVDTFGQSKMIDEVRNRPNLSNRPIRLSSWTMTPSMLVAVCRRGDVTLITRTEMHRVGIALHVPEPSPPFDALIAPFQSGSCLHPAAPL